MPFDHTLAMAFKTEVVRNTNATSALDESIKQLSVFRNATKVFVHCYISYSSMLPLITNLLVTVSDDVNSTYSYQ